MKVKSLNQLNNNFKDFYLENKEKILLRVAITGLAIFALGGGLFITQTVGAVTFRNLVPEGNYNLLSLIPVSTLSSLVLMPIGIIATEIADRKLIEIKKPPLLTKSKKEHMRLIEEERTKRWRIAAAVAAAIVIGLGLGLLLGGIAGTNVTDTQGLKLEPWLNNVYKQLGKQYDSILVSGICLTALGIIPPCLLFIPSNAEAKKKKREWIEMQSVKI